MIPWLLARESRLPFSFWVCEKAVSPMVSLMLFRTFYCILRRPSCVPIRNFLCKVSCWRFKPVYEPVCLCQRILKHRKNRKGTPGFERNAIKKNTPQQEWEKSLDSQTLPEYNFKLYKIFRYETELFL